MRSWIEPHLFKVEDAMCVCTKINLNLLSTARALSSQNSTFSRSPYRKSYLVRFLAKPVTFHKMQMLTTIFFRSRRRRFPQVSRFRRNHQHWVSRCIRANVVQAPISRDFLYDWHMPSGLYVSTILFAQYPGCGLQLGRRRFVIAPYWYVHWCLYYWPVHLPCPEFFGTRDKRLKVSIFFPRCFSRISNFLISILVEKRWESFCKCVPREIAFPQWVNERIFLHETPLKYPSRTFLGQCGTLSWVKGRTISRCLKQWLKNRSRKGPKKKRILIHRNCLFCKVLNKVTLVDSFWQ